MAPHTLRPRSVTEIIDASFQLARRSLSPLLVLSAVASIPSIAFALIMMNMTPASAEVGQAEASSAAEMLITLLLLLVMMCWGFISYGAMLSAASRAYLGETADPAAELRHAFSRAQALILGNLLGLLRLMRPFIAVGVVAAVLILATRNNSVVSAIAILLIAVLAIPAMVYYVRALPQYVMVSSVAVLENHGVRDTVRRTWALTDGFRLKIVGVMLIFGLIFFALLVLLILLLHSLVSHPKAAEALAQAVMIPLMPFFTTAFTVLYYDIRVRKEGFDLEMLEAQVAPGGVAPTRA